MPSGPGFEIRQSKSLPLRRPESVFAEPCNAVENNNGAWLCFRSESESELISQGVEKRWARLRLGRCTSLYGTGQLGRPLHGEVILSS